MNKVKVVKIDDGVEFDNGSKLYSYHIAVCCENHELCFTDITLEDFEGLEFDLSTDNFFKRVEDYGIELIPINGYPVRIPGYGCNNGYYSSNLNLVLTTPNQGDRDFDITECQSIS